jgi:hypothetical protein
MKQQRDVETIVRELRAVQRQAMLAEGKALRLLELRREILCLELSFTAPPVPCIHEPQLSGV